MKVFQSITRTFSSPGISFAQCLSRNLVYRANRITKKLSYHIHTKKELEFNLVEIPHHFNYEEYLNNLKSPHWISYKIDCLNRLLKKT